MCSHLKCLFQRQLLVSCLAFKRSDSTSARSKTAWRSPGVMRKTQPGGGCWVLDGTEKTSAARTEDKQGTGNRDCVWRSWRVEPITCKINPAPGGKPGLFRSFASFTPAMNVNNKSRTCLQQQRVTSGNERLFYHSGSWEFSPVTH